MTGERKILIVSVLSASALLLGGWLMLRQSASGDAFAGCRESQVSGGMESFGTSFTLTDQNGQRITDQQVFEKPSLLYFGYTFCPDVCPLDAARNAAAIELLSEKGLDAQSVFVTVDPGRDTPEVIRDFADAIDPGMIGLTGTADEVDAVTRGWRSLYQLHDGEDAEFYLVDHTTHTFLVLPDTGTVEFFGRDVPAEDVAERTACFIDAAS